MLKLESMVSTDALCDLDDVVMLKKAFMQLGYYELPHYGFHPYPDDRLINAIRTYQQDRQLYVDGIMRPQGQTIRHLAAELEKLGRRGDTVLAHITPEEARHLHRVTDGGTVNPVTGLLEFNMGGSYGDPDSDIGSAFGEDGSPAHESRSDDHSDNNGRDPMLGLTPGEQTDIFGAPEDRGDDEAQRREQERQRREEEAARAARERQEKERQKRAEDRAAARRAQRDKARKAAQGPAGPSAGQAWGHDPLGMGTGWGTIDQEEAESHMGYTQDKPDQKSTSYTPSVPGHPKPKNPYYDILQKHKGPTIAALADANKKKQLTKINDRKENRHGPRKGTKSISLSHITGPHLGRSIPETRDIVDFFSPGADLAAALDHSAKTSGAAKRGDLLGIAVNVGYMTAYMVDVPVQGRITKNIKDFYREVSENVTARFAAKLDKNSRTQKEIDAAITLAGEITSDLIDRGIGWVQDKVATDPEDKD